MPETKRRRPLTDALLEERAEELSRDEKPTVAEVQPEVKITKVKLQSIFPARVIILGPVTKARYDFPESGSILEVDERDVSGLLEYRIGTSSCCGGTDSGGNRVFQLV